MLIQQLVTCFCQNGCSNSFGNSGRLKIVTVSGFPFTSFSLLDFVLVLIKYKCWNNFLSISSPMSSNIPYFFLWIYLITIKMHVFCQRWSMNVIWNCSFSVLCICNSVPQKPVGLYLQLQNSELRTYFSKLIYSKRALASPSPPVAVFCRWLQALALESMLFASHASTVALWSGLINSEVFLQEMSQSELWGHSFG